MPKKTDYFVNGSEDDDFVTSLRFDGDMFIDGSASPYTSSRPPKAVQTMKVICVTSWLFVLFSFLLMAERGEAYANLGKLLSIRPGGAGEARRAAVAAASRLIVVGNLPVNLLGALVSWHSVRKFTREVTELFVLAAFAALAVAALFLIWGV
ncbi:MAG: hypothetical protein LBI44_01890 [Oscillospiraceae bacterium]|jgi:hypothetical protein|nr:hypothetical protein [Oscillospiraceae bacterium]